MPRVGITLLKFVKAFDVSGVGFLGLLLVCKLRLRLEENHRRHVRAVERVDESQFPPGLLDEPEHHVVVHSQVPPRLDRQVRKPRHRADTAVEKDLISESEAEKMSQNEILSLIFKAGFSTAEQVSSVSGRGVGMDVVKTAIERIGGTVELQSTEGRGTIVRIRIPLTLAIISALVVQSGGECFAIPQLGVVELVRLAAEDRKKIERIHENEVFRLRNRLLPLVHLHNVLGLDEPEASDPAGDVNIVVVQVGEDQMGLIVAEVELSHADAPYPTPGWLGPEVSDHVRYFNVNLIDRPYAHWSSAEREGKEDTAC